MYLSYPLFGRSLGGCFSDLSECLIDQQLPIAENSV